MSEFLVFLILIFGKAAFRHFLSIEVLWNPYTIECKTFAVSNFRYFEDQHMIFFFFLNIWCCKMFTVEVGQWKWSKLLQRQIFPILQHHLLKIWLIALIAHFSVSMLDFIAWKTCGKTGGKDYEKTCGKWENVENNLWEVEKGGGGTYPHMCPLLRFAHVAWLSWTLSMNHEARQGKVNNHK